MFRDFVYLDINRVQSIIAQLQQGLLNEVIEGSTEQRTGRLQMATNLLAMLLPVNVSGSVEQGSGSSLNETRVLHDYAFEVARLSLEESGLLKQDELDWQEVPEEGFVLVRGAAQVLDYESLRRIAKNIDRLDDFMNPEDSKAQRQKRHKENKQVRESEVLFETFFDDAIRVEIINGRGCGFIGPLAREHLREDVRGLIYKHGSRPKGAWTMLAEVSRIPLPHESPEDASMQMADMQASDKPVSDQLNKLLELFNALQEGLGSASYPDIAVSPVAVYREINADTGD
jgi:flagellin-specific chaperone FliS